MHDHRAFDGEAERVLRGERECLAGADHRGGGDAADGVGHGVSRMETGERNLGSETTERDSAGVPSALLAAFMWQSPSAGRTVFSAIPARSGVALCSVIVGQQNGTMQALILQVSDFSPETYPLCDVSVLGFTARRQRLDNPAVRDNSFALTTVV
jgi:hypothetical protein